MEVSCACEIFKGCCEGDASGAHSVLSAICGGVSLVIDATCLLSDFCCVKLRLDSLIPAKHGCRNVEVIMTSSSRHTLEDPYYHLDEYS
jgi:hypothetical protein